MGHSESFPLLQVRRFWAAGCHHGRRIGGASDVETPLPAGWVLLGPLRAQREEGTEPRNVAR